MNNFTLHICGLVYLFISKYIVDVVNASSSIFTKNPCANRSTGYQTLPDDYCHSYFYCLNERVILSHICEHDHSFDIETHKCVPSVNVKNCIPIDCSGLDNEKYFIVPHTKCRMYYQCQRGERVDYLCGSQMSFSYQLQMCVKKGICYEPICNGRVDGNYPDTTQQCERSFTCSSTQLVAIHHCPVNEIFSQKMCINRKYATTCQRVQETAVALHRVKNICNDLVDGVYTTPNTQCKEYFICQSHVHLGTLTCSHGYIFNGTECVLEQFYHCKDPGCTNRSDGFYADIHSDCHEFFYCQSSRIVWRNICPGNTIFNGDECVDTKDYKCPHLSTIDTNICLHLTDGYHRNHATCNEYFLCGANELILKGTCPDGQVWNGSVCVNKKWFYCDGPYQWIGCLIKSGFYTDTSDASQCAYYYYCSNGKVTRYACAFNQVFNGEQCVPKHIYQCPVDDNSFGLKNCSSNSGVCNKKSDGFYVQPQTHCQNYVQCEMGKIIKTFYCPDGHVFDGNNNCVDKNCLYNCQQDGFFTTPNSNCKMYYFCINGRRTDLQCSNGTVFNGHVCVNDEYFVCDEQCHLYKHCLY